MPPLATAMPMPTPNVMLRGPFGVLLIVPSGIAAGELRRFQVFSPHGGAGGSAQGAANQILYDAARDGSAVQAIRGLYVNRWGHLTGLAPDALVDRLRRDLADGIMFAAFYIPSPDFTRFAVTQKPDISLLLADPAGGPIAWSRPQRIAAMLRRVPANMPEAMRAQVAGLFTPQAIALFAIMLAALAVAQFYGVGEIVDAILVGIAWATAGWAGLLALKAFIGAVIDSAGETTLPPIEADAKTAADALGQLGMAFIIAVLARARDQENIFAKDEAPVKDTPPVKKPAPVAKGWKDYPSTAGKAAEKPPVKPAPLVRRLNSKPKWLQNIEAGNKFNADRASSYPYNEVYIKQPSGTGYYRLDSYDPEQGEIVSRKFTQLSDVQESTANSYINELVTKYPVGATVGEVPSSGSLGGATLQGQYILEVPVQNNPIPQSVLDTANRSGVLIRDTTGHVY